MRTVICLLMLILGGCKRESSFDESFKANQSELASKAAAIDAELDAAQASDASPQAAPSGD